MMRRYGGVLTRQVRVAYLYCAQVFAGLVQTRAHEIERQRCQCQIDCLHRFARM